MRILLVGASGTIGSAVRADLGERHEFILAGRKGADVSVDITSPDSIAAMYRSIGRVDAVISAAGATHFGSLLELTPEKNEISIESKLKGQVNLVLLGLDHVKDHGSFTLTTGIIMDDPIKGGASSALAGGAVRAFVQAAAIEMPRGIRINNVSPSVLVESIEKYGPYFPGVEPAPASRVALAYRKSVEGAQTGQTYTVY
jgi:NAD(P)-dependent dehydrogenase (short-subunit alcohol dehydrogenase family)